MRGSHDFDRAFATLSAARPDALLTLSDNLTVRHRQQIVDFATTQRLPMLSEVKEFAEAGGLMTYGGSLTAMNRRAATWQSRDQVRLEPECLKLHTSSHRALALARYESAVAAALQDGAAKATIAS